MNLPPLITGSERLDQILYAISSPENTHQYPGPLVWVELFIQYYPQAAVVFEKMIEPQRREAIDLLKMIRPESWQKIILDFLSAHDLSHSILLHSLTESECDQIASLINYWELDSLALILKRSSGPVCAKICARVWFGEYYRFFSHHLFALFSQLEQKEAFWRLQSFISKETAFRLVPAIKEDVDILLKWILSASKSAPTKDTIKSLELIFNELNENQRRRLIVRSVRFYPETFLFILTVISEYEAKLICRETLMRMNRFLLADPGLCRSLIPESRGPALQTILSRGRFPLKNSYHHTYEDIFQMLKSVPAYDKEDLDCIDSIPPFIFSFFEYWSHFKTEIKLVINDLNEHQLRALSFGINKANCKKLLPELEKTMSPRKFSQFLSLFEASLIEPYLDSVYNDLIAALEKAKKSILENKLEEIPRVNLSLNQLRQSPVLETVLRLVSLRIPGLSDWANKEIAFYLNLLQNILKQANPVQKESERSLYALVSKEGDRDIGLLDDGDLAILGVKTLKDCGILEQYRNQAGLKNSWKAIHSKRIYSLKELENSCLTESKEEYFKLHELAVKLL